MWTYFGLNLAGPYFAGFSQIMWTSSFIGHIIISRPIHTQQQLISRTGFHHAQQLTKHSWT
jgi:hypothetical protein